MRRHRSLLAALLAPLALGVQTEAQDIVVSDANVFYAAQRPTPTQSDSVSAIFTTDDPALDNLLFEHWFYYRVDADAAATPFKDDGTLTILNNQGPPGSVASKSNATWTDVDNRGLLSAVLGVTATSSGTTTGWVEFHMAVTNISASPVTLDLYTYIDADVCAFSLNDAVGTGFRQSVTRFSCSESFEISSAFADAWEVDEYSSAELGLQDGSVIDLTNMGLPFNGDYTGAMQWADRVIQPGETQPFIFAIAMNGKACPSAFEFYGNASDTSAGTPGITVGFPRIGNPVAVLVNNAPAGESAILLKGLSPVSIPILGMTLLVDPLFVSPPVTVNNGGVALLQIPIPNNPALCGGLVYDQWIVLDANAPNGLAGTTRGATWNIGF